jgi:hypothetical protein
MLLKSVVQSGRVDMNLHTNCNNYTKAEIYKTQKSH